MPQRGQKAPALAVLLAGLLAHSMGAQVLYGSLIGTAQTLHGIPPLGR
jgi:hypothetical protein